MKLRSFVVKFIFIILPDNFIRQIKNWHYARLLKSFSTVNEKDFQIVRHLVKPGDYVVDIGANIGLYTRYLATLVGATGRVYSIEPVPSTFEILQHVVKKFHLQNVELINCAIADSNGSVNMVIPCDDSGQANIYRAQIIGQSKLYSGQTLHVEAKTFDSLFLDKSYSITFVKCDVEGHEFSCLTGASQSLLRSRPMLLIEIEGNPICKESAAYRTFDLLHSLGYDAYWFDGANLRKWRQGDRSINYFFFTSKHLEIIKESISFSHLLVGRQ